MILERKKVFGCLLISLVANGCTSRQDFKLYTPLSPDRSRVDFENTIVETPEVNILTYEYAYNGGGVAAGDFNNDGLCDLYFSGNQVPNKLYLNQGKLEFKDVTESARVAGRRLWKTGVATVDINNDGWLDIYVCYSGPEVNQSLSNELYINQCRRKGETPTFTEEAKAYGLDAPETYSTQASFFDYDGDGDLDMFLLNHGTRFYSPFGNTNKLRNTRHPNYSNRLYRNEFKAGDVKPRFVEVSAEAGIHGGGINFGLGVSVSDLNNDGWPDIYVTNDYEEQDFLYLNNKNGTFTESSKKSFGHFSRNGMGTDAADFNNDLLPDLVEVDMWPEDNHRQKLLKGQDDFTKYQLMLDSGFHYQQMRNTLQLNLGTTKDGTPMFSEIGQLSGISSTDWSWTPLFFDVNNDELKDLFVSNGHLREFTSMDFLKFTTFEMQRKAEAEKRELPMFELVSKMPSEKTSDYLFLNKGNLTFQNISIESGIQHPNLSFGATYADLDNDGDLEIITNNTNEKSMIWINHTSDLKQSHFVKIRLIGSPQNINGIGAKVIVKTKTNTQLSEVYNSRGFQSSVESNLVFGLAGNDFVENVKVVWPDGLVSILSQLTADQNLEVKHSDAKELSGEPEKMSRLFDDVTESVGMDFIHSENNYVDFNREPLLLYRTSRLGPTLAKADVNGDGDEDFYIGGAAGQSGQLYLSTSTGKLKRLTSQPWMADVICEDTGATFFDADNDGDQDLFVVSGGNEFPTGAIELVDRLYLNNGNGSFARAPEGATVQDHVSGSAVAAADYDKDGDIDLFVAGRISPGNFPSTSPGAILRNDTDRKTKQLKFVVATKEVNSSLREPGMVSDAIWTDFNNDTWPDLIVVGHWMPILMFENKNGKLIEFRSPSLENTSGLWNRILANDFDNDGDTDYVIGNAGTNLPFKVSAKEPMTLYSVDIDGDRKSDPIICSFVQGKSHPIASRDELLSQVNLLRRKFRNYELYSNATIEDILDPQKLAVATKMNIQTLTSVYLENNGKGDLKMSSLPIEAQFSAIQGLLCDDYNDDGFNDILLAGNFFPYRTQYGPSDASNGLLLAGNGKGKFASIPWQQSGFFANGDVRAMVYLKNKKSGGLIVIGKNNEKAQVVALKK